MILPISSCCLYAFVDTAYLRERSAETVAAQLCAGGADLIQLRAKGATRERILALARSVLPICRRAGVALVINDWPELARQVGAPLCHLGQEDFFEAGHTHVAPVAEEGPGASFAKLGEGGVRTRLAIGLSTHAPEQARRAVAAGADYIAIGPVFATGTKPSATPVTLEYVRWAAEHVRIPWFAIGGITLRNLDEVLAAGARRVCVVSAILDAPDVTRACREFKNRLTSAASGPGA